MDKEIEKLKEEYQNALYLQSYSEMKKITKKLFEILEKRLDKKS